MLKMLLDLKADKNHRGGIVVGIIVA